MTIGYACQRWFCIDGFSQEISSLVIVCLFISFTFVLALAYRLYCKNKALVRTAQFDPMTGALNHLETNLRCESEIARSVRSKQPFAVLEIDIDHFKHVNDRHGHQVGDQVLASLVTCVKKNLRVIDLFGRIGGEEFLAILPETNAVAALETAERLRESLQAYVYSTSCGDLRGITVSIGVAVFSPPVSVTDIKQSEARELLIKQADDAMYEAKNSGRNRVVLCSSQSFGAR